MARYVEDLIMVLPLIAGVDWQDPGVIPMPLGDPGRVDLQKLRISFHTDNGIISPTAETTDVVRRSARILSEAGSIVEEARPEGIEESNEIISGIYGADGGAGVRKTLQAAGTREANPFLQQRLKILSPFTKSISEFGDLMDRWDSYRRRMVSFMERYEAIICPACAFPALPHETTHEKIAAFSYTRAYNLTGWPAVVIRGGTSSEGLPIGVQVVACPWREDVALRLAGYIESALGGWQPPPL
jgi:amidase